MVSSIIIIIICILLSAFFSGMEIAYVSSNKVHLEIEKKQESYIAKTLVKITKRPSKFLTTMLVGNNISLVIYGFEMGRLMTQVLPYPMQGILWHTIISTLIILLTAEFFPKVIFQIYANTIIKVFAVPAYFFYILFTPISAFIMWISDIILKLFFKTQGDSVQLTFSKVELVDYISEQMENIQNTEEVDSEVQMFQNALGFSEVKAREVMVPRTEIEAVDINEDPQKLKQQFIESGYSKIIVYKESIDDIIGYVHSFEMFKNSKTIKEVLRPVVNIPETILISEVLDLLTKKHKSIAVVLDEYGGTSGILTLEDIVEELFGEIEDEHDMVNLLEKKISDTEYIFSARLEVDYLNDEYKLEIPESENYETLGGFIVDYNEDIPKKKEVIKIPPYHFIIEDVTQTRILTVRVLIGDKN